MSRPTIIRDGARRSWSFEATAYSSARVDVVWPLLGEARRWKEWTFLDSTSVIRAGRPHPDGVGALRSFTRRGIGSLEQVVAWEPPHHLGYILVRGIPVRGYRADVVLRSEGNGTAITWTGAFDARIPGTGRLLAVALSSLVARFARDAARYAESLMAGSTTGASAAPPWPDHTGEPSA
ncbi:MAG: SRPBCC family protein [Acidimicrobiales bacterium]